VTNDYEKFIVIYVFSSARYLPHVFTLVVIQSQRRQRDLCYYSFNILRAREQLMAAEKYEFFLSFFRLWFSYRLRHIIYETERIECRMRIAYNDADKLTGWRNLMLLIYRIIIKQLT
jgi:hypothetical protein